MTLFVVRCPTEAPGYRIVALAGIVVPTESFRQILTCLPSETVRNSGNSERSSYQHNFNLKMKLFLKHESQ